jgi:phosphoserine phosphatase
MALTAAVRLIAFDLDGTLLDRTVYIWSTLHEHFGSDPARRRKAADDYHAGRISYADWFHHDLLLLSERGADRAGILRAFDALRPAPGAGEVLRELKRRGYRLAVISGSLDVVLEHFFPGAPFDHVLINRLELDAEGRIAGGTPTPFDLAGKAEGLSELARREGLTLAQCAFVGDNINDLPVMRAAGFSVGVRIKSPEVAAAASLILPGDDLRELLALFPGPDGIQA